MEIKKITSDEDFKELIVNGETALMISKSGCPFCDKAKPWLEDLSKEFQTREIALVNKDDIPKLMEVFQVQMYPTFVLIKDGVVIDTFFGDTQEDKVKSFMSKNI